MELDIIRYPFDLRGNKWSEWSIKERSYGKQHMNEHGLSMERCTDVVSVRNFRSNLK